MKARPGDPDCPVANFKKYVSKLNPGCSALFQHPKSKYREPDLWYDNVAVGKNKLGTMVSDMRKDAQLSEVYTNHCLRKTTVISVKKKNFSLQQIHAVKWHKNTIRVWNNILMKLILMKFQQCPTICGHMASNLSSYIQGQHIQTATQISRLWTVSPSNPSFFHLLSHSLFHPSSHSLSVILPFHFNPVLIL